MDGLGFLIYQLYKIQKLYTPVQLADLLKQAGVKWVSWKVSDGSYTFNQVGGNDKVFLDYINTLAAAGIESGGWSYVYPRPVSPGGQGGRIGERIEKLGLKHILIDVEKEWMAGAIVRKDIELMLTQISVNDKFPMGFCSYRYPQQHPGLKYNVFMNHYRMKFAAPQVYWLELHDPDVQLQDSYDQYKAISGKPFVPIGCTFTDDWDWLPTTEDFKKFIQKCVASKWYTYGFYTLDWLLTHNHLDWLEAISGATINPPGPVPVPVPTKVRTKATCNVRNAPDLTAGSDVGDFNGGKVLDVTGKSGKFYKVEVYVAESVVTAVP